MEPPPPSELVALDEQCGGGLHKEWKRKRWDPKYQMFVQLFQPYDAALAYLATLDDVLLNRGEVALDLIFASEQELDAAHEIVSKHHRQRWHGEQEVRFYKITRYSAGPRAANKLANYADKACRITGEVFCLHIEWRLIGAQALRRAGLGTVGELLEFDHRRFWQDRLLLQSVNLEALGRQFSMHVLNKGRRRGPWIEYVNTGHEVMCSVGSQAAGTKGSVQALVDQYRKQFDVGRCLEDIEVEALLPVTSCSDCGGR